MRNVPQWALDRVDELSRACGLHFNPQRTAFAKYIAEHEDEPVDPLLIEAREVVAQVWEKNANHATASRYRSGDFDDGDAFMEVALAALKSREPQS